MPGTLRVRGLEKMRRGTADMARRARDLTPAMQAGALALIAFIDDRFDTSTDPSGRPWQGLAPSTIARRRGETHKILVDTARLRNSVFAVGGPKSIRWGTATLYAGAHQYGVPERGLVPRPFLPVNNAGHFLTSSAEVAQLVREIVSGVKRYILTGRVGG